MSCCWKWGSQLFMLDRQYTLPRSTHSTKSELSFSMIGICNSVSKQGSIQGTIHSSRHSVNPSIPPLSQATYKMPQLVYSKAWKNALSDSSLGKPSKIDQSWWFTAPGDWGESVWCLPVVPLLGGIYHPQNWNLPQQKCLPKTSQTMCGVCSKWVLLSGLMTPFETTNGMEWHNPLIAVANLFAKF